MSDQEQRDPRIAARIPEEIKTRLDRIAYEESEPGWQKVSRSDVIRAALRHYVDGYAETDHTAAENGHPDVEETEYDVEPPIGGT